MKLTSEQIREIADNLDAGMKIFINRETLEYRDILDWDDIMDSEPWDEELEKIESEWDDFVVLEKMESRDAFRVMEDFIDEIDDETFSQQLAMILRMRSPFANFKAMIEASPHREAWFAFKASCYIDYTKELLELNEIEFER